MKKNQLYQDHTSPFNEVTKTTSKTWIFCHNNHARLVIQNYLSINRCIIQYLTQGWQTGKLYVLTLLDHHSQLYSVQYCNFQKARHALMLLRTVWCTKYNFPIIENKAEDLLFKCQVSIVIYESETW